MDDRISLSICIFVVARISAMALANKQHKHNNTMFGLQTAAMCECFFLFYAVLLLMLLFASIH